MLYFIISYITRKNKMVAVIFLFKIVPKPKNNILKTLTNTLFL